MAHTRGAWTTGWVPSVQPFDKNKRSILSSLLKTVSRCTVVNTRRRSTWCPGYRLSVAGPAIINKRQKDYRAYVTIVNDAAWWVKRCTVSNRKFADITMQKTTKNESSSDHNESCKTRRFILSTSPRSAFACAMTKKKTRIFFNMVPQSGGKLHKRTHNQAKDDHKTAGTARKQW